MRPLFQSARNSIWPEQRYIVDLRDTGRAHAFTADTACCFHLTAPILVTIVYTEEKIRLPHLDAVLGEGLIAVSDVEVIRYQKEKGA